MWTMEKDGHRIILAAHIDDFILASSNLAFLEAFHDCLLDAFEGTEGAMTNYSILSNSSQPAGNRI